jgi:hypothetical protein
MKIEELLQKIIDIATKDEQPEVMDTESEIEAGVFLPPLQLNTELMKRAVGVDNVLDREEQDDFEGEWQDMAAADDGCGCDSDPLDAIRRNAGLPIDAQIEHPQAIVISQGTSEPRF